MDISPAWPWWETSTNDGRWNLREGNHSLVVTGNDQLRASRLDALAPRFELDTDPDDARPGRTWFLTIAATDREAGADSLFAAGPASQLRTLAQALRDSVSSPNHSVELHFDEAQAGIRRSGNVHLGGELIVLPARQDRWGNMCLVWSWPALDDEIAWPYTQEGLLGMADLMARIFANCDELDRGKRAGILDRRTDQQARRVASGVGAADSGPMPEATDPTTDQEGEPMAG